MYRKIIIHKPINLFILLSILALSLAIFSLAQANPTTPASPGDLDQTFAGFTDDGVIFTTGISQVKDIAVQPDGKIVAVGYSSVYQYTLAVFRYLPNGELDPSFGVGGQAFFADMFFAKTVALQSDGAIVVGGTRDEDFQLARLTPGGALDTSFDGDGWLQDFDDELNVLDSVLVQPDGKIVACGGALVDGDFDF